MDGFVEVITVMLALGGFGVDDDPHPPDAAVVLEYAVPDADVMAYVDLKALLPRDYDAVIALAGDELLDTDPALRTLAREVRADLEGLVGMARTVVGVDLLHDVSSVTGFLQLAPDDPMAMLVVVRGTFPDDLVARLATVIDGQSGTVDGRDTLEIDADVFLGTTADGALLVGARALVEPRIDDDWKTPRRRKGTPWATIGKQLDATPFALVAAKLDTDTAASLADEVDVPLLDALITGHQLAILSLHDDGLELLWKDRTKAGLKQASLAADGAIELLRAASLAPRGLARLAMAALAERAGSSDAVDAVLARQDELLDLVDDSSGDGTFTVTGVQDKKKRTFTLRATGKELSDVIPASLVIPAIVAALLL